MTTADNIYYQYSLTSALLAGIASSGTPLHSYIKHGDHGLGTFLQMEGELIMLSGSVYQMLSDGSIRHITDQDTQLPYAAATHFRPQDRQTITATSKAALSSCIADWARMRHAGQAFIWLRIDGDFKRVRCRTARGQRYEGQSLRELGEEQAEQVFEDVRGSLVGVVTPEVWQGIGVAGLHVHFIDERRERGGHVLEIEAGEVEVQLAVAREVRVELPEATDFNAARLERDDSALSKVEG